MQFQHLFVDGPTFFKEQIAQLEIAVIQQEKAKSYMPNPNQGNFSEKTGIILNTLQEAERPLYPREVAERSGLNKEFCSRQMSKFLSKPESYGVKAVNMGKGRAYTMI